MSNSMKREYDKLSLTKDIIEREKIIYQFQTTGFLDRNAINSSLRTFTTSQANSEPSILQRVISVLPL